MSLGSLQKFRCERLRVGMKDLIEAVPKCLMVQGTTSDSGKSTLVTALCRILRDSGVKNSPFKPQNMALNSAVTEDGGEIGRAQALQAVAAGLNPLIDMNPVLLKPTSEGCSQIILQGKVFKTMSAREYYQYKEMAWNAVSDSFKRLSDSFSCVVVEGAGSPAEINLRSHDIANMGFAEAVNCPVVLVADIDRGGVFAHIVGTLELLSENERERVVGFVINRFRGDVNLLKPGIEWLEQKTGKRVFGVLPYLKDFQLDAEDSMALESQAKKRKEEVEITVVVIVYPRVSNFTDFDPLVIHPKVNVIFIRHGSVLPPCDLIILPGSKNVRGDLEWLIQQGYDKQLKRHVRYGGKILGICGGFQMLGNEIIDTQGMDGDVGYSRGLSLLPVKTEMQIEKKLSLVHGTIFLSGRQEFFSGYEIHVGKTQPIDDVKNPLELDQNETSGVLSIDDQVLGVYIHGIFETGKVLNLILEWTTGICNNDLVINYDDYRNNQIDRLAKVVKEYVDVKEMLGECSKFYR